MTRAQPRARCVLIELDRPIEPVAVEPGYDLVLLVVRRRGTVLGTVRLPALETIPADVVRSAVIRRLAGRIWLEELEERFFRAVGGRVAVGSPPGVSVVVCTRDRPDDLRRCLDSLAALDPAPLEVIVVDSAPARGGVAELCAQHDVAYLHEPVIGQSRARNRGIAIARGEIVAFTDDDCVVDPGWLGALHREFGDRRVGAVTGIVLPYELETPAQWLFEMYGGHDRGFRRFVVDGIRADPLLSVGRVGVGANVAFRREALEAVGPFTEWLGPGTPAKAADDYDMFARLLERGDRIVYSPRQLVWHRHRATIDELTRTLHDYGLSSMALATQRWLDRRDRSALAVARWWLTDHIPRETFRALRGRSNGLPASMVTAQLAGVLRGPSALTRSRRSRDGVEPVPIAREAPAPVALSVAEPPSLSVVVPTVGRMSSLGTLLERLAESARAGLPFETVVVLDGASPQAAAELEALELPYALHLEPIARSGVAIARNRGVERASGDVIVFLDDDVVPDPGCLVAHASAHARGDVDVTLGYAPPVVGRGWWEAIVRAWWEDHFRRKADPSLPLRWTDIVTLNSTFRRRELLALGGFDPTFDRRHEDWELGVRVVEGGLRVAYLPEASSPHNLDASLEGAVRRARDEAASDVALARRHPAVGRELPLLGHLVTPPVPRPLDLESGLLAAREHERRGRRRAWRQTIDGLFSRAYRAGLADALPDREAYDSLKRAVLAVAPQRVVVDLDGGPPPRVPSVGAVELSLRIGGAVLGPLPPGRREEPWDWETAYTEVEARYSEKARLATVEAALTGIAVERAA